MKIIVHKTSINSGFLSFFDSKQNRANFFLHFLLNEQVLRQISTKTIVFTEKKRFLGQT